jgi:glycosyltransferase involved in cell wall biosynthesis
MPQTINIIHFHNGKGGGVWSVIKNLIKYSCNGNIKQHVIFYHLDNETILSDPKELPSQVRCSFLKYSPRDNFYHTCRRLAKLIPDASSVLIAHDWLELGMCSHLGLVNPLVYYMHGDYEYYYSLFEKHRQVIDETVTVSLSMKNNLSRMYPGFKDKINYIRFPVPDAPAPRLRQKKSLVFVGRLEAGKGFDIVLKIADELRNIPEIFFHIVGTGNMDWQVPPTSNMKFYGNLPNEKVLELLSEMEILLLPSTHEGMPIVVIEAMKSGVVPLVSDIPGGIQELIINGKTGFRLNRNDIEGWRAAIMQLQNNSEVLLQMSSEAKIKASAMFDPLANVRVFEEELFSLAKKKTVKKKKKTVYGSRLDHAWLPNSIVRLLRR